MSRFWRILLLLRLVGARGASASEIGDVCQIASHALLPILWRLCERGEVVAFYQDEPFGRRRIYRLASADERCPEPWDVPRAPTYAPRWGSRW